MHILVLGATGGVGRSLVEQALANGDEITAAVRTPEKLNLQHPNLHIQRCDAFKAADVAALFTDNSHYDAVASALNTNQGVKPGNDLQRMLSNIAPQLQKHRIKRIVYCASAGVDNELEGERGQAAMEFLRHPLADHRAAIEQIRAAGLDATIVRPLGLTHDALSGHYIEAAQGIPAGNGRIARADVAHFILKALHNDAYIGQSIALSGV
ncbi:NAD(P)-dependent oxidoreductase [Snodgrassella communis]|uniref:NAD(P)-dependent oxidoreductase n=1 Tax=Snodgrassella communis TaxID=2946699 RepID=UPI001EF66529|nr:NAD(P)-binding oxidoreductase [Snodgrassella communis]